MTASFYLARAGRRVALLERDALGGKAANLGRVENYPGFPRGIDGAVLMRRFWTQARAWGVEYFKAEALSLAREGGLYRIRTQAEVLAGRSVLLCTGARFLPWRELEGAGPPVFNAAFGRAREYAGRPVAVVGGGETAVHQSLALSRCARTVHLVHRGGSLRAIGALRERVENAGNIEVHARSRLALDRKNRLRLIGPGRRSREIAAAAVFALIGQVPELGLLRGHRSVPGLFTAGDARHGVAHQIAAAAGDAMRAAMECEAFLRER